MTNYDPQTGQGDGSFTSYEGGNCDGANFNSKGPTQLSSGINHLVVLTKPSLQNPAIGNQLDGRGRRNWRFLDNGTAT
jgi:hypothetical protein